MKSYNHWGDKGKSTVGDGYDNAVRQIIPNVNYSISEELFGIIYCTEVWP